MITTIKHEKKYYPPRVEVITSVQRRRRWPIAEKIPAGRGDDAARDVGFLTRPRRAGVAPSLLFNDSRDLKVLCF